MSQNIYDSPTFFSTYATLPRSTHGLSVAPEWPALRSMVLNNNPTIQDTRVLDLGCGYGWFCRWAVEEGRARHVRGIDISERMLERARELTPENLSSGGGNGITYLQDDLDVIKLDCETYDIIYSSLTLHYIRGLDKLLASIYTALKPGGRFVFSVEHPIYTAPSAEHWHKEKGEDSWLLNGYGREGERVRNWLGQDVRKYHRTTQTYLGLLLGCGFRLSDFVEWMPSDEDLEVHPEWAVERNRPAFLLVAVGKDEEKES
ncbi:class I SAM-dependent methyltransferase [Aspergillus undulatus]|uniref:class I SAM-dependent methyltransferase n=1 Tax=Aspergillus undulatus TaxID=1810928 RepID=UPI003CCDB7FC